MNSSRFVHFTNRAGEDQQYTKRPALVAELKNGNVIMLSLEKSARLFDELIKHLKDIEKLREEGIRIAGSECYKCGSKCKNKKERAASLSLNNLNALSNIECVFKQLIENLKKLNVRND